jgi:prepilin-type N-terminal cleavage/methylation domain-containing protein
MPEMTVLSRVLRKNRLASFTLIELLTVMAIILILAAFMLFAASGLMTKAKRSRASNEIQAMSTALEGYKTDNGIYPTTNAATGFAMSSTTLLTNTYAANDGSQSGGVYQTSSQLLYLNLSGQTNFTDNPASGVKVYMSFKRYQVGDAPTGSYVKDPWGYSYGYSTGNGTTLYPYNGNLFFDLWSTGGVLTTQLTTTPSLTNAWISNWQ